MIKRLFNISIVLFLLFILSFSVSVFILLDYRKPDHYTLLFLQPLVIAITCFCAQKYIAQLFSRISSLLIFGSYYLRMVIVPLLLRIGNYHTLLSDETIRVYMTEAILLTCYEWIIIFIFLIRICSKYPEHVGLYESYSCNNGSNLGNITIGTSICVLFTILLFLGIIVYDKSIVRNTFLLMIGTPDGWTKKGEYGSWSGTASGRTLGVFVTIANLLFWYIQAFVPPVVLIWIKNRRLNEKVKICLTYFLAGIVFLIITETRIHSVECAFSIVILAYSIYGKRMRKSLRISSFIIIAIVCIACMEKSGMQSNLASVSAVFAAYFGGVQNLSATMYLKYNSSVLGMKNILPDLIHQIPLLGSKFSTILGLGKTSNRLFNSFINNEINQGQIMPSIGQGFSYFGMALAPVIPLLAAYVSIIFDKLAIKEKNIVKKNIYLIASVMLARAVIMTNLMSAVGYIFNTIVPLIMIWFWEALARNGKSRCR